MTAVYYALGVVLFFLAILASIGLHELGHLIPAKAFGGKVTQYFIGFGPTVWSTQRGETEVGVKAIPLGGYVKIIGMLPPGAEELGERQPDGSLKVRRSNTGMFTQLISDARAAEWELVQPGDEDRLFYKMTWWKKVIVMAGGPTVNLLIAFALFSVIFGTYGVREVKADAGRPVLDQVSQCVVPYSDQRADCRSGDPESPAAKAGLRPGDTITSFNGTAVTSWDQLKDLVRANEDGSATIGYLRDGTEHTATTNTTVEARPASETDQTLRQVGFLGVSPTTRIVTTTGGPVFTLERMGGMTRDSVVALAHLPVKVWGVAKAIAGVSERDPNGPVSIVGGGRIAGEAVSDGGFPLLDKVMFLFGLVAGFNLFIGLFNFVPLLPLDGGHIASALWEAIRRGLARLRRRPDPGYVDAAKLLPVAYVVASALLVMGGVLIVGDLVVPVHLQSQ
ncbi:site-2 protease family protein [Nocardioides sp. CER19]|uniref:M50 family metallopeptidase n=1 Tax=Nocardioides sp. CER19 TaxID=3038538 RepID=UPI002449C78D|nr:site-2 protease family protein [Nocardioides sp. CER19]MDH2416846.1 site-2 protease family protein [Nocardioides sp. CER19]